MTTKMSDLDQASADRRSFGNPALAANAELKVIAEAMRELVVELRLMRCQLAALAPVGVVPPETVNPMPTVRAGDRGTGTEQAR